MGPPAGPSNAWAVYDGRLYLNFMPRQKELFFADPDTNIKLAEARWASLWGAADGAGPFNTDCKMGHTCEDDPQPIPRVNDTAVDGSGTMKGESDKGGGAKDDGEFIVSS